jgi:hypothetical protein
MKSPFSISRSSFRLLLVVGLVYLGLSACSSVHPTPNVGTPSIELFPTQTVASVLASPTLTMATSTAAGYPALELSPATPLPYPPPQPSVSLAPYPAHPTDNPTSQMTITPDARLSHQTRITIADNGRTFTYPITGRFLLFLDKTVYPEDELVCKPEGIVSWFSNGLGLWDEQLKLHSVGFEGVEPGICIIQSKDFKITIRVVDD